MSGEDRMERVIPALAVAGALLLAAAGAGAQDDAAAQEKRARELFDKGVEAYGDGDLEGAIGYMQDSYLMHPKPVVVYNLAVLELEAEMWVSAGNHLHAYLETEENISGERRLEITQTIEDQIRLHASLVQITGIEVGGSVLVDGVDIGAAGIRWGFWVTPGDHEVAVPGGESKQVTTLAGETVLVELQPPPEKKSPVAGWIVGGVGLAAAATGAGLLGQAKKDMDVVESAAEGTDWSVVDQNDERARTYSIAGAVLLGVGGAALVAGTVLLAVTARHNKKVEEALPIDAAWLSPLLLPGGGGLALGGTF